MMEMCAGRFYIDVNNLLVLCRNPAQASFYFMASLCAVDVSSMCAYVLHVSVGAFCTIWTRICALEKLNRRSRFWKEAPR